MAASQINRNLQIARENAGMEQESAAPHLGVHAQTLSKYERGVIQKIPFAVIEKACALYGETIERMTKGVIEHGYRLSQSGQRAVAVREATSADAVGAHTDRISRAIVLFEREAARLGASDAEVDHIHWSLHAPENARLVYVGEDGKSLSESAQDEQLAHQMEALRTWLARRHAAATPAPSDGVELPGGAKLEQVIPAPRNAAAKKKKLG